MLSGYQRKAHGLPDLLLYASLVDDGVLLLQNGALMAVWSYRGPDLASATHEEMAAISSHLNDLLRLGTGWMVQCDAIRTYAPGYPESGAFPDPVSRLIDDERRQQFTAEGRHLESEYFLTLTYLPPFEREEKLKGYMFEMPDRRMKGVAQRHLDHFNAKASSFGDMFELIMNARRLRVVVEEDELGHEFHFDELLRFVRRTIHGEDYKFALPEYPDLLHDILGAEELLTGLEPMLGDRYIGVVAIDGFPMYSTPGMLSALDSLPFEYRWNTRARMLDAEDARSHLKSLLKKWRGMERGFIAQLIQSKRPVINEHAGRMAQDAATAMSVAAEGSVQFGFYSGNVVLLDKDYERLHRNLAEVVKVIKACGYGARIEGSNTLEAWRGSLPGDGHTNLRRFTIHTLNLADMLPLSAVWTGLRYNPSYMFPGNSPPLMLIISSGATPFRLHLHVGDLGHTIIIGPTGAGKSTFLCLIIVQWFRYANARVIAFDKKKSMYVLNQALGGMFYDLMGDKGGINFCPLADLSTPADRAWATDYIESLVALCGLAVTPAIRNAINEAVQRMAQSPESRSLYDFISVIQDHAVREALMDYTHVGPNGSLLDARSDTLKDSRFVCFEMDTLMASGGEEKRSLVAVLLYLFRKIAKTLDGSPTLLVLDEAWVFLKHPRFRAKILEWLKEMRKMNVVVILSTQGVAEVLESPIASDVLASCPTKIYLANAEATGEIARPAYEKFGLNKRQIQMLSKALPKMDYYVTSPLGRRMVRLGIGAVAKSFVGVSSIEERSEAEKIQEMYGEGWVYEWLRHRSRLLSNPTLGKWAEHYHKQVLTQKGVLQG
jgi:type IV secretion system protein VirB4